DITNAIQFERLSIPKRLEQVENELRSNRIADPERLVPLLEKIEKDSQIMNYARTQAGKIKKQIQKPKKPLFPHIRQRNRNLKNRHRRLHISPIPLSTLPTSSRR